VADTEAAWHSGKKEINKQSIGVEIVAWKSAPKMTVAQDLALVALARFLLDAYDVPLSSVIPHRALKDTDCPGLVWQDEATLEAWKIANLTPSSYSS
jgi:N-acetyl-anhydromuramyl-L-alanine amidase AmpD